MARLCVMAWRAKRAFLGLGTEGLAKSRVVVRTPCGTERLGCAGACGSDFVCTCGFAQALVPVGHALSGKVLPGSLP